MNRQYSVQYDAYYDADTGEWLEIGCGDPRCEYCEGRPEKAPMSGVAATIETQTKED